MDPEGLAAKSPRAKVPPLPRPKDGGGISGPKSPRGPLPSPPPVRPLPQGPGVKSPMGSPRAPGSPRPPNARPVSPRPPPKALPQHRAVTDNADFEDMLEMNELTTESIVRNLSLRYARGSIYTAIGDIIVSVNPYRSMPHLYSDDVRRAYTSQVRPPHVFSVASAAFAQLSGRRKSQSIIATGESGAGKTEAAKLVVNWFSTIVPGDAIHQKMVLTSSVLEAFGNAQTIRNHNSSRFGKYFKIQFDENLHICGGFIDHFLLELARVTGQAEGERCFHVFYFMLAGMSNADKESLGLTVAEDFNYTRRCTQLSSSEMNDVREWSSLCNGLEVLGIGSDEQQHLFSVLAGILWLGQIEFHVGKPHADPRNPLVMLPGSVEVTNPEALGMAARLLGVPEDKLGANFERRTVQAQGRETVAHVGYTLQEAYEVRDTLARGIYGKIFDWIVARINQSICAPQHSGDLLFIGILDIFGFENFPINAFEQLLINLGNERLQNMFIERVFLLEVENYAREGINWTPVSYPDNSKCLELLEDSKMGILAVLDDDCALALGSDKNFLAKIIQMNKAHPNFATHVKSGANEFTVHHYAGPVTYCSDGFRKANLFVLRPELVAVFAESANAVLVDSFRADLAAELSRKKTAGRGKLSVSKQYRGQLTELSKLIKETDVHYIRCIRPNLNETPDNFVDDIVKAQLAALGILATVQVRKAALPNRFAYAAFYERFWSVGEFDSCMLMPDDDAPSVLAELGKRLAAKLGLEKSQHFAIAKDKDMVYLSHEMMNGCERLLSEMYENEQRRRREEEELRARLEAERLEAERQRALEEERQRRLEEERLRALQQQRLREEEEERRRLAEAERLRREQEERDRQERERLRRLKEEEDARRAQEEQERLERQRQEEEELRRRMQQEEEERQRRLQEERDRAAAEARRKADEARRALEEQQMRERMERQRLADEQHQRELYENKIKEQNVAKGFIRPTPLNPDVDWSVHVKCVEIRKAKDGKRPAKEIWIQIGVVCGVERWEVLKGPGDFAEFQEKLRETLEALGSSKGIPPLPDLQKSSKEKDVMGSIQSFLNFFLTDPFFWKLPQVRQFLLAGLNNVDAPTKWISAPLLSGILTKKKGKGQGINKKEATRWCAISRRTLYYYAKDDVHTNPKGIIALDGSIVAMMQSGLDKKAQSPRRRGAPSSFTLIQNDGTNYLFTASDESECKQWVETIGQGNTEVQKMTTPVDGVLEIEIIACADLQGIAEEEGLANPFVIAYVEGQQIESVQRERTLNPIFRQVYGSSPEPIPCCLIEDQRSLVWLTVWSKGNLQKGSADLERLHFLGMAVLPVSSLANGVKMDAWIPLAPRSSKEKVSGSIRVALTYKWANASAEGGDASSIMKQSVYFGATLSSLFTTPNMPTSLEIPVLLAQIVEYFGRNKACVEDSDFFQPPQGPEWVAFLRWFEECGRRDGKLRFHHSVDPVFVMGLLYYTLRHLKEPLLSFRAFNTLFGESLVDKGGVHVDDVCKALGALRPENRKVLGYVVSTLRLLVEHSPLNSRSSETVLFGKVVKKGGKVRIRRRTGQGVTIADVVSAFGTVLARPPMETERTVLSLIETNAVLEYVIFHSNVLFPDVNLEVLYRAIRSVDEKGGAVFVPVSKAPVSSPRSLSPRLPMSPREEEDSSLEELDASGLTIDHLK